MNLKENTKILSKLGLAALVAASPAAYQLASMNAYAYNAGDNVGTSVTSPNDAVLQLVASKYGYLSWEKKDGLNYMTPHANDDTCGFAHKYIVTDTATGKSTTYASSSFANQLAKGNYKIAGLFYKKYGTAENKTVKGDHGSLTFKFDAYDSVVYDDNSKGYELKNSDERCSFSINADKGYKLSTVTVDGKTFSYETEANKIQPRPDSTISCTFVPTSGSTKETVEYYNITEGTANGNITVADTDNGYVYLPVEKHTILNTDEGNNTTPTVFLKIQPPKYTPDSGFKFKDYTLTDAQGRTYSIDEYNKELRYGNPPAITVKVNFEKAKDTPDDDSKTEEFQIDGSGTRENITLAKSTGGTLSLKGTITTTTYKNGNATYHKKTVKIQTPTVASTDKGYEFKYFTSKIGDKTQEDGFTDTYSVTYRDDEESPEVLPKVTITGVFEKSAATEVNAVDTITKGAKKKYGNVTIDNTKGHISIIVNYTDDKGYVKFKSVRLGTDPDDGYTYGIRYLTNDGREITKEEAEDLGEYTIEGYGTESNVRKETLAATISTGKDIADKLKDGDSKTALNKAIEDAQKVYDNKDATQKEVNKAIEDLLSAITSIQPSDLKETSADYYYDILKRLADTLNAYANKYGSNEKLDQAVKDAREALAKDKSQMTAEIFEKIVKELHDAGTTPYVGTSTTINTIAKGAKYTLGNTTIDNSKGHSDVSAEFKYGKLSLLTPIASSMDEGYKYSGNYEVKDVDGKEATVDDADKKAIVITPVFTKADGTPIADDDNKPSDGKADDGKADDGKTDDGKTDDGKADDGKADDGKTDDGKTDDGKADDGKTDDGKTDDGKADDGKTDDGKTDDGKADDGKTDDGKADDGKADDGKTDDGKTDDGKADDGKTDDGKTDDGKADDNKSTDSKDNTAKSGDTADQLDNKTDDTAKNTAANGTDASNADAAKNATDSSDTADQLDNGSDTNTSDTADQIDSVDDNDDTSSTDGDDSATDGDTSDDTDNDDVDYSGNDNNGSSDSGDDNVSYDGGSGRSSSDSGDDGKGNTPDGKVKTGDATMISSLIAGISGAGAGIVAFLKRKKNK